MTKKPKPWLVHLPGLRPGENRFSFEVDIAELGGAVREVAENPLFREVVGPLAVELQIVRSGKKFLVSGKVNFIARLTCATCSRTCENRFSEELASEFVSEGELDVPERELESDELSRELLQGNVLNLSRVIRDAVHLAIPIAPKCGADCMEAR